MLVSYIALRTKRKCLCPPERQTVQSVYIQQPERHACTPGDNEYCGLGAASVTLNSVHG